MQKTTIPIDDGGEVMLPGVPVSGDAASVLMYISHTTNQDMESVIRTAIESYTDTAGDLLIDLGRWNGPREGEIKALRTYLTYYGRMS